MTIRRTPADVVQFTRESAERISRVVRESENATLPGAALTMSPLPEAPRKVFRICAFTGAWSKNTLKTITLRHQTTTPNTFVARNLFAEIGNTTATARSCAIAREGTAWYLVAAEC